MCLTDTYVLILTYRFLSLKFTFVQLSVIVFQINYWVKDEQNETMALFRIIHNQTDHGLIIALRENTDYFINVQVVNSAGLGPKSETYPVRTLRAGIVLLIFFAIVKKVKG